MAMKGAPVNRVGLVGLACVLAAVYFPGLRGPLLFDDIWHIARNPNLAIASLGWTDLRDAAMSADTAYPKRGIVYVTFALNRYLVEPSAAVFAYKTTNLLIHLLNVLLVYALSHRLLRRYAADLHPGSAHKGWSALNVHLPLLVAALWGLHPIQLTSVLYVVQRMNSLSALFVFAGLLTFVIGRTRVEAGRISGWCLMLSGLVFGTVLGVLSKENAALLPFLAFAVELFFFRRRDLAVRLHRHLLLFYVVIVGVPAALLLGGVGWGWDSVLASYVERDFGPIERVMTQPRILFFYVLLIFVPNIQWFGLYHDDIVVSSGWLQPWTTLPSFVALISLIVLAVWSVRRQSLWGFAILWYLIAHAIESSVLGLEMVFEHRNYVPSFGVLFAASYYLLRWLQRIEHARYLTYLLPGAIVVVVALATASRASIWVDKETLMRIGVRNHPDSSRYHAEWAMVLSNSGQAELSETYSHLQRGAALDENQTLLLALMVNAIRYQRLEIEAGRVERSDPLDDSLANPLDVLSAPLKNNPAYLRGLEQLASAEVGRRMRERPVVANTMEIARLTHSCVIAGVEHCAQLLPMTIEWYRVAVEQNVRVSDARRAVLMIQLGMLYGLQGDIERAEHYARQSAALERDGISLKLGLAYLYLTLGDLDKAEQALVRVRAANPAGYQAEQVLQLLDHVEEARRQRDRSNPSTSLTGSGMNRVRAE